MPMVVWLTGRIWFIHTNILLVSGAYNTTGTEELTKLTFTNDKAYDSADGTEMTTIDQAFKQGDKVVGNGDITLFADTACFSHGLALYGQALW